MNAPARTRGSPAGRACSTRPRTPRVLGGVLRLIWWPNPDRDRLVRLLDLGRSAAGRDRTAVRGSCCYAMVGKHPGCESTWGGGGGRVRWLRGRSLTDLANLVLLCSRHRGRRPPPRRAHSSPWDDGRFRFLRQGRVLQAHVDPSALLDATPRSRTNTPTSPPTPPRTTAAASAVDRRYASSAFATNRYAAHNHGRPAEPARVGGEPDQQPARSCRARTSPSAGSEVLGPACPGPRTGGCADHAAGVTQTKSARSMEVHTR